MKKTTDRYGKTVKAGSIIRMANDRRYRVFEEEGKLGCYEDGEFIPLEEVLKVYTVEDGRIH